jgi:hypothetical protein
MSVTDTKKLRYYITKNLKCMQTEFDLVFTGIPIRLRASVNPSGNLEYQEFALPSSVYNGILKEKGGRPVLSLFDV